MITWLKGIKRVKTPKYTQEISGYRCSGCNAFETSPRRKCPNCGGEYKGKIQKSRNTINIKESEE